MKEKIQDYLGILGIIVFILPGVPLALLSYMLLGSQKEPGIESVMRRSLYLSIAQWFIGLVLLLVYSPLWSLLWILIGCGLILLGSWWVGSV